MRRLEEGLGALGLTLGPPAVDRLWAYAEALLRWNEKVNLTAITNPTEVVDKHLLDSLAVVPEVAGASTLLDLGAGAGLPGIPLAVALPELKCTLVDAVAKKVAFMKTGAVKAGVTGRVRAMHQRVAGRPRQRGWNRPKSSSPGLSWRLAPSSRSPSTTWLPVVGWWRCWGSHRRWPSCPRSVERQVSSWSCSASSSCRSQAMPAQWPHFARLRQAREIS